MTSNNEAYKRLREHRNMEKRTTTKAKDWFEKKEEEEMTKTMDNEQHLTYEGDDYTITETPNIMTDTTYFLVESKEMTTNYWQGDMVYEPLISETFNCLHAAEAYVETLRLVASTTN